MIPVNPGNLLPFYSEGYGSTDRRWQRHRQHGTDVVPYGLPCPKQRLVPFQVPFTGTAGGVLTFALVNPEDDTETVVLDTALLEVSIKADLSGFWVTWKADENLDVVPDCGFWYIVLEVDGYPQICSEVLDCRDMCGFDTVRLVIRDDSCLVESGNIQFALDAVLDTTGGETYVIQRFGVAWVTIATNDSVTVFETLASETRQFRIVVTTECGLIITKTYTVTWDDADGCGTIAMALDSTVNDESDILTVPPVYRLNFSHSTDKNDVLYQTGYEQYLYLPLPVWDVPAIDREIDSVVNGNGAVVRRFTRTVERRGFEVADIPDYLLGFLAKAGDHDTIIFEDAKLINSAQAVNFQVENLTFESPDRQGTALNIGRFYFDVEAEAFAGCQENFELAA